MKKLIKYEDLQSKPEYGYTEFWGEFYNAL